jgi:HAD superfamily hydrolase (TIGR01509 family)
MVRAVCFDLFETLVTESETRPSGVASLAPSLGCERRAFRKEWKALRPAVVAGRVSFRQAISDVTAACGRQVDAATLQSICDERVRSKARPFQEVERPILMMLDALRQRGVRLGVISNCCAEDVAAWSQSALAARVDCALFSFDVGLAKPDARIFLEAARRLGVAAADTWFVGDGADEELAGAERAGLRALQACWFLKRWPHWQEDAGSSAGLASVEDVLRLVERSTAECG